MVSPELGPHQVHLMKFVGGPSLRAGVLLTRQERGEADPERGQPDEVRWRPELCGPGYC